MISYKGFNLPGDMLIVFITFYLVLHYTVLNKLLPTRKLLGSANKPGTATYMINDLTVQDSTKLTKVYRASTFFLTRVLRSSKPCLRRTLVLKRWCSKNRINAQMIIGVRKTAGKLESHAWLEINGTPFRENPEFLTVYTSILEN